MASNKCKQCGAEKPLSEYYESNKSRCKNCVCNSVKLRRVNNDSVREYDRKRGCRQDSSKLRKWREENPKKWKAHQHIQKLVKKGLINKSESCEDCGSQSTSSKGIHGHHDDYDKPDIVRWLCAKCHHRWHAEHGEALNPI